MLKIQGLESGYGESQILKGVDIHVGTGDVVALMGRNGMGKTTLLKTITGLIKTTSGQIHLEDQNITSWTTRRRASQGIAYVPQGREIFPFLTVEENLILGLEAKKEKGSEVPQGIFDLFPVLKDMLGRLGGDLSGGQQQQLAIARALISEPKVLLLDEPTEGIQPSIVQDIENTIRFIKEQGTISIILVEQYFEFAWRLADSYAVLERGSVISSGLVHEVDKAKVKEHLSI